MQRDQEPETGRTRFIEAEEGPVLYEYNPGTIDQSTGLTTKGATIKSRTIKMDMFKKK